MLCLYKITERQIDKKTKNKFKNEPKHWYIYWKIGRMSIQIVEDIYYFEYQIRRR